MKLAAIVVLVVACKGKDADTQATPAGSLDKPPSGGPAPTKASVTSGEVTISGAFEGTFHWKDDLALTCTWIPGLSGGAFEATMTDDKGTFIALEEHFLTDRKDVILAGTPKSPGMLVGKTGFTMTGSDDANRMSATIDSDLDRKDGTKVHVKAKLDFACPH